MSDVLILAFESSCDETSVAVVKNGREVLSNIIATQIKSHQRFGGVVPEVASRHHVEQIIHCTKLALKEAQVDYQDLAAVAVTYGPGLVGSLLIGLMAAKAISWAHDLPLIGVNHLAGHIYAANLVAEIKYPALALVVSGGHTELVYVKAAGEFEILGDTRDDAVGEAYDKVGRMLGISYPAGKTIDQWAHEGKDTYNFPRAMLHENNLNFSFSGIKSAVINTLHHAEQVGISINKKDVATSFQNDILDILLAKTQKALHKYPVQQLIVAGGVAANSGLRERLQQELANQVELIFPPLRLCGDNAAMIGAYAYIKYQKNQFASLTLNADPSLDFEYCNNNESLL
ncbi:tRNA (adenosine(37)-N6)-threonylcarbamoyltransferase complex transferase subunit TsaD [Bombilactobacillus thymidiniphilus]|uniref:tRNA N6-adenosine threonylcarbamoyltransferase n=1 Tax=Bombilactobacillus thymidiniphilus TaxID=2923363 RepID=A0ABY4PE62_9LACO|nr:tRNA (adenosine(37)-N6)-threonylcarbamoyltransferase complex transferase subunit TsaD [Bombilactobacillus thymidiniphilus]UQS83920.1 tRNA (adenosine(37)-N6)-threonylcarbamoyltransferase complex transferase subunit TsaD [Bombilactobacillus thymidiniphilus]